MKKKMEKSGNEEKIFHLRENSVKIII